MERRIRVRTHAATHGVAFRGVADGGTRTIRSYLMVWAHAAEHGSAFRVGVARATRNSTRHNAPRRYTLSAASSIAGVPVSCSHRSGKYIASRLALTPGAP